MKTEYSHVKLPPNTIAGATVTALSAKPGVTLTRVTETGRDDLEVRVVGNPRRSFDIAWSHVKGGVRTALVMAPKPVREPIETEAEEPDVVPVDDKVRVTKRRGKAAA